MKATEIREFSQEELVQKEMELKDQLFKLKFQHTLGQLENSVKMKNVRRDIARIKTIVTEMSEKPETVEAKVAKTKTTTAKVKVKVKDKKKDKDKDKDKDKKKDKEKKNESGKGTE